MISKGIPLSRRQRETLSKAFLNTSNAILAGWVLTRYVEQQTFAAPDFLWGCGLYSAAILMALWVYQ